MDHYSLKKNMSNRTSYISPMSVQIVFILVVITVFGCELNNASDLIDYPNQFGEIPFDAKMDDSSFELCDATALVHSRTSLSYVGGRVRIEEISKKVFDKEGHTYAYDGYVLVRFLVNCKGEIGRLRFESLDGGFMQQVAPEGLVALVRKSVEALNEWTVITPSNKGKDHSKYLNFKIKNGHIDAIIH